eukprot:CAMPEP_0173396478 /NCGR_PEP_ID=MMETSP1356-20130122/35608_1 /TAXON_ID=77927 ORGANISM="Hemiselmis virescens, Strain PCC157" /NCGR_SAMPLE_ID=MMETSP1356 /ASSEMBLY_ACC=CAM_ASM_000847 /LENGTH=178 /DNA_ID=CAMNT_0014355529 /DNA_START=87 /DNA_END=620 /DNA_ORIENTATION=-
MTSHGGDRRPSGGNVSHQYAAMMGNHDLDDMPLQNMRMHGGGVPPQQVHGGDSHPLSPPFVNFDGAGMQLPPQGVGYSLDMRTASGDMVSRMGYLGVKGKSYTAHSPLAASRSAGGGDDYIIGAYPDKHMMSGGHMEYAEGMHWHQTHASQAQQWGMAGEYSAMAQQHLHQQRQQQLH